MYYVYGKLFFNSIKVLRRKESAGLGNQNMLKLSLSPKLN